MAALVTVIDYLVRGREERSSRIIYAFIYIESMFTFLKDDDYCWRSSRNIYLSCESSIRDPRMSSISRSRLILVKLMDILVTGRIGKSIEGASLA